MGEDYTAKQEIQESQDAAALASPTPTTAQHNQQNNTHIAKLRDELSIAGYSKRTMKMYLLYTGHFLDFIKKPADGATRDDVVAFLAMLKENQNASNATLALAHSALKYFYHSLLHLKILGDIKVAKKSKKLPTVLTKEEVKKLIAATKAGRNRLLVEFLYSSGTRVSEAVKIKMNELDLGSRLAVVRGGKGNKDRMVILSNTWVKDLKKYLKHRSKKIKSEFVFSKKNGKPLSTDTAQRIIRTAAEKAGIQKHVTPHAMRHSFATHLLESGESIRKIQELLGHSSLSTTQIYTRVSTDELRKVSSPLDGLRAKTKIRLLPQENS